MNRLEGRFAAQQIPGGREYQEDDYGLIERGDPDTDGGEVLLLADGMGGHVSGDTASRMVVKTFAETFHDTEGPIPDRLRACLTAANDALAEATDENPELKGMGSTVVAAVISQHGLDWISVGDSPLWLFLNGKLHRLNADHSMAPVLANLVAVGRMTEEEAATDSNRHALRSAVMGDEIHLIDVSSQPIAIRKSDRLLLASDGVMTLEDEEIARIIENKHDAPLEEVAEALIHAVEESDVPIRTIRRYCSTVQKPIAERACFPMKNSVSARRRKKQNQKQTCQISLLRIKCSQRNRINNRDEFS